MIRFDTKKDYDKYFEDIQKIIDLEKENQQLQNNWNELKEYCKNNYYGITTVGILEKMQELEGNK